MPAVRKLVEILEWLVRSSSQLVSWLLFALVAVICIDVLTRKINARLPYFDSTRLQELEWHFHGVLFLLCLGYGYLRNAHVRIDVASSRFAPRTAAWVELAGCVLFAIPFCLAIIIIGTGYFRQSFVQNEMSEAATGLPYRWIIKGMIPLGMSLLLLAVVSVALRQIAFLFGSENAEGGPTRATGIGDSGDR